MKKPIPMLGLGVKSGFPTVTAQERINCYIEQTKDSEKQSVVCYGTPGLTLFSDALGDTPVRGMYSFQNYIYVVHRSNVYKVNGAKTFTLIGTIASSTGRVGMTCNTTQLLIVDGSEVGYVFSIADNAYVSISLASPAIINDPLHGLADGSSIRFMTDGTLPTGLAVDTTYYVKYIDANNYNVAATRGGTSLNVTAIGSGSHSRMTYLSEITAAGFPGGTSAAFLDGYMIINQPNTQKYYISSLYDALSWSALEFASAESNADLLKRVYVDHSQILLLGDYTTENHGNSGALDFPFSRTGLAIDWGIVGAWSIARLDNSVAFLARKRMGEVQVVLYTGATPQRISNSDIERLLNSFSNLDAATAWSFSINGHPMYVLNVGGYTLMYDMSTGSWSKLKSYGIDRHRGEISETLLDRTILSDYSNGNLYYLDNDVYTDNGDPLIMEVSGKHVFNGLDRLTINDLCVDMTMGVGLVSGQGVNPRIGMQYSKNSGNSWSNTRYASMGNIGEYGNLVSFPQLGQGRDFVIKLIISDPVKRQINGVYADIEANDD
jgi:hypothetical protein